MGVQCPGFFGGQRLLGSGLTVEQQVDCTLALLSGV